MVLLDRYMNRNVSNTENLPPTVRAFTKRGTPTLRSNVHCRRVSASAFARTQYLQAQKLTHAAKVKVRRVARYSITVPVATPEPKTSTPSPTTVPVTLPRVLPRQPFQEIPLSALAQFGAHTNVEYLRDSLPEFSSSFVSGLLAVKTSAITTPTWPKELEVSVNAPAGAILPSHLLAIYRQPPTKEGEKPVPPTQVTVHPVHSLILAANCARIPVLEPSEPIRSSPFKTTLPVKPLGLPAPESFPLLQMYLYTKRQQSLQTSLLPVGCVLPPSLHPEAQTSPEEHTQAVLEAARHLAQTYTAHALLQSIHKVMSLWQNVRALGIFDAGVWGVMDGVWELLLEALSMSTRQTPLKSA
ncbi:hypothetical protein PC9H_004601 [Pleurotus ostreatus]|uniref:Clp1 n=1 Tax=Pleurotus ostreatus TaxID=5322 RepID=A0A8H6ZXJ1_PLEOS|nr:uncharacterized protein PC9H_004601 [Pleurotus ostreatus]KAF7432659.1 hypothetical protein PC9H_004601 [Pleurotus ostreatus]